MQLKTILSSERDCAKILSDVQEKRIEVSSSILVLVELVNVLVRLNKILSNKEKRS